MGISKGSVKLLRNDDGQLRLHVQQPDAPPVAIEIDVDQARDLIDGLAVALAEFGGADAPDGAKAVPVDRVRFSPINLPDVMVNESTGAVGLAFSHRWLGMIGVTLRSRDALTLGAAIVTAAKNHPK